MPKTRPRDFASARSFNQLSTIIAAPAKQNPQTPAGAPEMLKVLLKAVSDDQNVVPRLIANAADIERIARGETSKDIPALTGWRYELFGKKARALLTGQLALSFEDGQVRLFEPKS